MEQFAQGDDIVFVDTEVSETRQSVEDIGAVRASVPVHSLNGMQFRTKNLQKLERFLQGAKYVCGHNIVHFDQKYIKTQLDLAGRRYLIDTLYMSPLLFPQKPYHKLLKDDKLQTEELNNPLNDAIKSMELFLDEVGAFRHLTESKQIIYHTLLGRQPEFRGFFHYVNFQEQSDNLSDLIHTEFQGKLCEHVATEQFESQYPVELAYCLATISADEKDSIIPYWVQKNYPKVQDIYHLLRGKRCEEGCALPFSSRR